MKITFMDGYIERHDAGATYIGETAHKIMHAAEKVSRESNTPYLYALDACVRAYQGQINKGGSDEKKRVYAKSSN